MLGMEKPLESAGRWNVPRRTAIAEDLPTTWCARWFANTKSPPAVRSQGARKHRSCVSIEGTQQKTSQTLCEIQWIQVILVGEPLKRYDAKRQSRARIFFGVRVNWLKCKK